MEEPRLALGRIDTRLTVMAVPEVAQAMAARLDRALREELPAALARAAAPLLEGETGILRMRRLRLRLDLGDRLDAPGLAQSLAERIAAALRLAIGSGTAEMRYWPDRDSYLAAYLLHRLGQRPEPLWAFPGFDALEHLPAERAAAEVIRLRPSVLGALARAAAWQGDPAAPILRWPVEATLALVRALTEPPLMPEEERAVLAVLRDMQAQGMERAGAASSADEAVVSALAESLRYLGGKAATLPPRSALLVFLAMTSQIRRKSDVGRSATTKGRAEAPGDPNEILRRAQEIVASDPAGRFVLAQIAAERALDRETKSAVRDGKSLPDQQPVPAVPANQSQLISPLLGLSLLLPSAFLLGAANHLSRTEFAQAHWQALPPELWREASLDPVIQLLLPVDPPQVDLARSQPMPPQRLTRAIAPAALAVFEASDPHLRWSALILADFASRLPGLQGSSWPYLSRQFLTRRGHLLRDERHFLVRLEDQPLGMVLRMAGLTGDQGALPLPGHPRLIFAIGGSG